MCKAALFLVVLLAVSTLPMEAQTLTVLHSFSSGTDGAYPVAGLVRDKQGNLYGTTVGVNGNGTVFKLDTTGKVTVLYSFTVGAYPVAGLVRDKQGNLYGTTLEGGDANYGTVFKLDTTGEEIVLHSFAFIPDGTSPLADLVRDKVGNLYGTTREGGDANYGTVFKLDTTGRETVLHSFTGPPDGAYPEAGLVMDKSGNLYGTTLYGGDFTCNITGAGLGCGTVFKLDMTGEETVLHSFTGPLSDGANPDAGLLRDKAGNLYGTTIYGGSSGFGTVFKLIP